MRGELLGLDRLVNGAAPRMRNGERLVAGYFAYGETNDLSDDICPMMLLVVDRLSLADDAAFSDQSIAPCGADDR